MFLRVWTTNLVLLGRELCSPKQGEFRNQRRRYFHFDLSKHRNFNIINPKMPSNVEIKAKVHDFEQLKALAESVSGEQGELIVQEDVFFNVPNGRLKLRVLQDRLSQLIFYTRPDQNGPKLSHYNITEIAKPDDLKITLGEALGVKGVVKKNRLLFLVGQTRIHLDKVENLGCFMELEVLLRNDQTPSDGSKIADELMKQLKIDQSDLITCAYVDLLSQQQK